MHIYIIKYYVVNIILLSNIKYVSDVVLNTSFSMTLVDAIFDMIH